MALKDTGQNLNKRHITLMQKLKFSWIPDDFLKKSGRVRVSTKTSGSGRVSGTCWALVVTLYSIYENVEYRDYARTEREL